MKGRIRKESKNKFKEYKKVWEEKINKQYPKNVIQGDSNEKGYYWFGIEMKYNDKRFLCGIGYDNIKEQNSEQIIPYYGITCRPESNAKDTDVENFVTKKFIIEGSEPTTNWYIQKRTTFENIIEKFQVYLNKIQEHPDIAFKRIRCKKTFFYKCSS
jgi:signal peptidase I